MVNTLENRKSTDWVQGPNKYCTNYKWPVNYNVQFCTSSKRQQCAGKVTVNTGSTSYHANKYTNLTQKAVSSNVRHQHKADRQQLHSKIIYKIGTCEASRFDSNRTIPIRFKSEGLIRNFWIIRTCHRTTNHAHCSTKKLQPLHHCNWDLFYVYDFYVYVARA